MFLGPTERGLSAAASVGRAGIANVTGWVRLTAHLQNQRSASVIAIGGTGPKSTATKTASWRASGDDQRSDPPGRVATAAAKKLIRADEPCRPARNDLPKFAGHSSPPARSRHEGCRGDQVLAKFWMPVLITDSGSR